MRDEGGSAVLEMVILAPVLLLLLALAVAGGRLALAHEQVDAAAGQAARAASIARSPTAAADQARLSAEDALANAGLSCTPMAVSVDTSLFRPGGSVTVTLTCTAQLGTLLPSALVGAHPITGTSSSVVDLYRGVSP